VDGPWKLTSFDTAGNRNAPIVFVPNPTYGGPQKAQVNQLVMHPYVSVNAQKKALAAGQLDSGYVLRTDVITALKPGVGGVLKWSALKGKFTVRSSPSWSFGFAYFNFDSATGASPLINQLYVRQALQTSIDQVSIIKTYLNGYGVPTYGPIPLVPQNDFAGASFQNPYPFSLSRAKKYLTDNGWTVPGTGTAICTKTAGCGAGIPRNTPLTLHYEYASANPTAVAIMNAEKATWAKIGINMILVPKADPDDLLSDCFSGNGNWQICQFGEWRYAPGYYPTGELLFYSNAVNNPGYFSDATMDIIIDSTTKGDEAMKTRYALYAAQRVPCMFQPTSLSVAVISTKVKGALEASPVGSFLPEYLHR
jgi:peptide/nickel transport system substrate-binding protein